MYVLDAVRNEFGLSSTLDRLTTNFVLIDSNTLETFEYSREDIIKSRRRGEKICGVNIATSEYISIVQPTYVHGRNDLVCYQYSNTSLLLSYKDNLCLKLSIDMGTKEIILNDTDRIEGCNLFSLPYKGDNDEFYINLYRDRAYVGRLNVSAKAVYKEGIRRYLSRKIIVNGGNI